MSSLNKKAPGASGLPQPFNRQAGHAPQYKPVVAQLKTGVSAQSVKRPVAPPVYRPQAKPGGVQAKMAGSSQLKNHPVAPPVYRPQPVPKVLQTKSSPFAPPQAHQSPRRPAPPPVYRPEPKKIVQPKMAGAPQLKNHPVAPPVYRPQPVPQVLQTKKKTVSQQTGRGMEAEANRMGVVRATAHRLPVQAKMANAVQPATAKNAAPAPTPFPVSGVIQRTAAADLQAGEQNRNYLVAETGNLSAAGVVVHNAINGAAAGQIKDDAAAGYRYFWQTLIDGFDGKKAEMYEAEIMANANDIPILSTNDLVDPDVRIVTGAGDVEATEVKTINSDNTGNVNTLINGADRQLGNRVADLRKIKIRIESAGNLWPDARYNNLNYITTNNELKNLLATPGYIPNLANANEIQIEGINVPYGGGAQKRNFFAEIKGTGEVKKTSARVW